jgi:hypothetical protein
MKQISTREETSSTLFNTDEWTGRIRANMGLYLAAKRILIGIIAVHQNTLIDNRKPILSGWVRDHLNTLAERMPVVLVSHGFDCIYIFVLLALH